MMSTELAPTAGGQTFFAVPSTGEALNIYDPAEVSALAANRPEIVAEILEVMDEAIRTAQDNRAWIGQFLTEVMDKNATQTLHAGQYTVTISGASDEIEAFDPKALEAALAPLVEAGIIGTVAVEKTIRRKPEVSKTGINALRALRNPEVEAAIDAARSVRLTRRRVTVKWAGR
jgi:hypothetical protein